MKRKKIISSMSIILVILIVIAGIIVMKKKETPAEEIPMEEPSYVETEQVDAPYEHWLAAAVMVTVSMDYPDFELLEVYMADETEMDNLAESDGIYFKYASAGEEKCIFSKPIDGLRNKTGTFDIMAEYIGYATYDEIDVNNIETENFRVVEIEDIGTLITQVGRVTKYMN
jgi:hypothetical protein